MGIKIFHAVGYQASISWSSHRWTVAGFVQSTAFLFVADLARTLQAALLGGTVLRLVAVSDGPLLDQSEITFDGNEQGGIVVRGSRENYL
jgi:hypothetical protein